MKSSIHHKIQVSGNNSPEYFLQHRAEDLWDDAMEGTNEKQFNFLKYLVLTGAIVLLIAATVFFTNRNQVSEQKEVETLQMISYFKK